MAANGEYVMTTGRDFLEYPEIDYEDCYLGDDDLSYGGSSDVRMMIDYVWYTIYM